MATASESEQAESEKAMEYSARGNTRWIVLRGDRGRAIDRHLVRHLGFSVITWQYAKAGGRGYTPTLLLTTIGRRSGKLRRSALPFHHDGDRLVVVGSNGGGPHDPSWVWNVRANPAAWIHVKRRQVAVTAYVAEGEERTRLFAQLTKKGDFLQRYEDRASTFGRSIPLVVLTPRS